MVQRRVAGNSIGTKVLPGITTNANALDGFVLTNSAGVGHAGATLELESMKSIANGRRGIGLTGDGTSITNLFGAIRTESNTQDALIIYSPLITTTFQSLSTLVANSNGGDGMAHCVGCVSGLAG